MYNAFVPQNKYICKCKKSNSYKKEASHVHFGVGFMGTKMIVYYKEERAI